MTTKSEKRLALASNVVTHALKQGADQAEAVIGAGVESSVEIREGEVEELLESGTRNLTVKVIVDGKTATASSSDFSKETLQRLINNAVERARLSNADPYAGLPDKEEIKADTAALKIYDPSLKEVPVEKKIAMAKKAEAIILADKRITQSAGASFGSWDGETTLVNSNGFIGQYKKTYCYYGAGAQAGEGDNLFQEYFYDSCLEFGRLLPPEEVAKRALHRITRLIGAKKVETQNVPLILEPKMSGSLLGFLYACINGGAVDQKQTFLDGKLGEKIGSDLLNVVDDGLRPGGMGTAPFDDEGVPQRRTPVIEKGVLKNYLMDTYNARKLKMKSTGNAGGYTNFYIEPGKSTPEEIIKSVDKGLYLTSTMGQGQVPTTGDISKGAFGLWIEKGEFAFPVAEITISGNLGTMLKGIEMVGNDLEGRKSADGPTVKIAEVTVGGA